MIGTRVRSAREACRLTQMELANLSGVSHGTIAAIEVGRIFEPSPEYIKMISAATGFPAQFFYLGPLPDMPEGNFRKLKRVPAREIKWLKAETRQVVELVQRAEIDLELPPVSLKPLDHDVNLEGIEDLATRIRQEMRVGNCDPIPNLTRAVERTGVIVVKLPSSKDLDSYSVWPDIGLGGRPLITLTAGHSGDRDRANLCHELGHLILHTRRNHIEPDHAEREAWRFAGAVLLPKEAAEESMQPPITLRVLMGVKATFGTSIAFNIQRAKDLGLIAETQFISLRKQLHSRGWYKNEPVVVENEDPLLIRKILDYLGGTGSDRERATRLNIAPFNFRALTG